jgi:hypothetical protein
MAKAVNPYGDGLAATRIVEALVRMTDEPAAAEAALSVQ